MFLILSPLHCMLKLLAFKKFKPLDYSIICIIKMYPVKWVLTNIFTYQTATALRMEQLQILQVPCPSQFNTHQHPWSQAAIDMVSLNRDSHSVLIIREFLQKEIKQDAFSMSSIFLFRAVLLRLHFIISCSRSWLLYGIKYYSINLMDIL